MALTTSDIDVPRHLASPRIAGMGGLLPLDLRNEPLQQLRGSLRRVQVRVNLRMPTCRVRFSQSTPNEEFR